MSKQASLVDQIWERAKEARDDIRQAPLADRIWAMVEEARDDIRQKVVEEPWFGRPVTEKLSDIHASLDQAQAKEQSPDRVKGHDPAPETERDQAQERDYGIDR